MKVFLLLFCVGLTGVACQVVNPWVDNSDCLPTDTPIICSTKKKQCAPINNIINAPGGGGLIGSITSCANATATTLDPSIYLKIGMSYAHGKPESLMENVSPDPTTDMQIRFCVLNTTGLIGTDYKFNMTAALIAISKQVLGPTEGIAVISAFTSCPEPVNYSVGPFMACLRKACMANASGVLPGTYTGAKTTGMGPKFGIPAYGPTAFGGGFF